MKILFYLGIAGIILFEIANVYFIMPMPGSQRMHTIDLAFCLYQLRWAFRGIFSVMIFLGLLPAFRVSPWVSSVLLAFAIVVAYLFNFEMAAEKMFSQPRDLRMADAKANAVKPEKLVLGIEQNGQAKAYPIQFMGYHHQVRDTIGGAPVMVTYCTVCRTGRVFSPTVNGKPEAFRLVGMDHFNAMFEDATTHSWWRQATGEAVAGPLKGNSLPEIPCTQTSLQAWLDLYPNSLVMQRDPSFQEEYDSMNTYDLGIGRGKLTRSDTASWNEKSWVVGIATDKQHAKAFDWNRLKTERMIQEQVGNQPIVVALAQDNASFVAYKRPDAAAVFTFQNDTLSLGEKRWDLLGRAVNPADGNLAKIPAYQEFWHSWRSFHPYTTRY
ncbi:MAG: DUF3179 domain-containing protein [Phycisphaerae bacterium]|nr:DUF3179 domain-containing protein [Saprospiraceae bacterium]